jgi:hypothetical protein
LRFKHSAINQRLAEWDCSGVFIEAVAVRRGTSGYETAYALRALTNADDNRL